MKLRIPSIARLSFPLASALVLMLGSTAHAVNLSFGTATSDPFTITATDQARAYGTNLGTFADSLGSVYWRGAATDATYMHFDLSSLAGGVISGNVSLNQTVDAQHGGQITNGQLSTASDAWTGAGDTPGFAAIDDSPLVNGTFATNNVATWTLTNATFQGFVDSPATFYGLVISAANPSQAHFSGTATLTGTATTGQINVSSATDWSAASFNSGTSTLSISGSSNVSGGNVALKSGATLAVLDAATLGAGTFGGSFTNNGTLSFGSSANQTLNGAVSGSGALVKDGSGTLTLSAQNTFTGPININGGTLEFSADLSGSSPFQSTQININNGSTLRITGASANMPIYDGKQYTFDANGGGSILLGEGNYHAWSTSFSFTTNGGARNNIGLITTSSPYGLNLGDATATFNVALGSDATSDLTVDPIIVNSGSLVKNGTGRLTLTALNTYTGLTSLNEGTLRVTTSMGLGAGGFDGGTMTMIANNAALELQGDLAINEHFHMQGAGPSGQGVLRSLSGNSSLTTNFALDGDSTFGVDVGTLTIDASIYEDGGSHELTKTGAGTLVLADSSSYSGNTIVSAGKLVVNGNISTSALTTVASGATLGGSGTVGKTVIEGTLAVGNSPGQMNFTDTLNLAGITIMEIDGTAGAGLAGGHDFVNLTGTGAAGVLTNGGTMTLDMGVVFAVGTYSWNLFDMDSETGTFSGITLADMYSGSLLDANLDGVWDLTSGNNTWQFTESTGVLGLTVIPEPNIAALLGGFGMLTLLRRRR